MMIPVLVVQAAIGILWALTAFRTLFHLWKRGAAMSGSPLMGPLTFLRCIRDWFHDPAERAWRWRLALLTLALLALSVGVAAIGSQSAR